MALPTWGGHPDGEMATTAPKRDAETSVCVTRRDALSALATTFVAIGCGGTNQSDPSAAGSGGSAGHAAASFGGKGGTSAGGRTGTGGDAGASALSCKQTGPTFGCQVTDDNILGPFYKAGAPFRNDITDSEVGTPLVVEGTVYGCDCVTPLAGAEVDVWQANDAGEYDNAGFVLRGRVQTDPLGRYEIRTILPGLYLNGDTYRPRHVHYKVSHPDGVALTTQLYFEGDPHIATDAFVKPSLVMPVSEEVGPGGTKQLRVKFDVVLA